LTYAQAAGQPIADLVDRARFAFPGEAELIQSIINELSKFTRENWPPGAAQRFGNTKTHGVVRGEFTVLPDLPDHLRHGLFAEPATYRSWVRFSGPGPYAPPDIDDYGQCSVAIKVMGIPGQSSWRTSSTPRT
jgi:hypothetical protein